MPATPNKGVYNFLINMSVNFKSTSKTSAVVGNSLRKLKQDFDAFATSAKTSGNSIKANIEQLNKPITEASKRASYFDTVWGKMFGVMMKFYSVMFFVKLFTQIGTALYNATINADAFNQKILAMYGYSIEGERVLYNIRKIANTYGLEYKNVSEIFNELRGFDNSIVISVLKLNESLAYGEKVSKDVIKALNNMRDSGKVSIGDLNELAKGGIYVWEELKKQLNLTDEQLKTIENSNVDIEKVIKAVGDAVKNASSNADNSISQTKKSLNILKNDFEDFKKSLTVGLGVDNIFSSIIKWIDAILIKYREMMINLKGSQIGMSQKEINIYTQQYEKNKDYMKALYEQIANTLKSAIYKIPQFGFKYSGQEAVEKSIELQNKITELINVFLSAEINQKDFLGSLNNLFKEYYKNPTNIKDKNIGFEEYLTNQSELINKIREFSIIVKKLSEVGYFNYSKSTPLVGISKQENAPITIERKKTESSASYSAIKLFSTINDLLKELQYNIENNIKNDLDGIYNFFEGKVSPVVMKLIKNLGMIDATKEEEVINGFDLIKKSLIEDMKTNIALIEKEGDIIKQYEYLISVQQQLAEIEQLKQEYIMKYLEMQLKTAVDIAKKQAEINKNNKFYQTLLSMSDFFDEVQQKIKVVSEATGQTLEEVVDTGLPKIKNSILDTMRYFYNTFSNIFEGFFSGDNLSGFQSWGNALSVVATGIFNGISGFLDNLVKNFGNLMLGSLFSALSQVQGIQALLDPLSYMLQVIASYILPTLNDLLTPIIGAITTLAILLAQAILPLLNGLMPFIQVLAQYLANILTLLQPLITAWSLIANVLLQALLYPLTAILQVLSPIIVALIPVFKFFAKILYWVGFIINGVIQAIAGTINVFIAVINAVLKALGKKTIPLLKTAQYMSYSDFNESLNANTGVSVSDLVNNAYNPTNSVSSGTSGSGGANYTTSAQRPITVNVNVENWFGDETATRKLALIIKNEFEIIGVL